MTWRVEKTVNGWAVMLGEDGRTWFRPNQFGGVAIIAAPSAASVGPDIREAVQRLRERNRAEGLARFGNNHSPERRALCERLAAELNAGAEVGA